jgi:hypothetical protein
MRDILRAYLSIFKLQCEQCKLLTVKRLGATKNETGETVTRYMFIIEAPSNGPDVVPDKAFMIQLRNLAQRKYKDTAGADVVHEVKWKVKTKKGTKKTKRYIFMTELNPSTIMEFQVLDGKYRIKAEGRGLFY